MNGLLLPEQVDSAMVQRFEGSDLEGSWEERRGQQGGVDSRIRWIHDTY